MGLLFVIKCIPIVGTAVTAVEAVGALVDGDGKRFFTKLAQTAVGGAMDAAFIMSGGASSLMTAPLKGGIVEGGKIVGKKTIEKLVVREAGKVTTNISVRLATEYVAENVSKNSRSSRRSGSRRKNGNSGTGGGGGGNDPPRYPKLPKEHEMDDNEYDSDLGNKDDPITYIKLGSNGRVEELHAEIKKRHLRPRGTARRNITARVKRFVKALGQVKDRSNSGTRESDEIGHIIADSLGGPHDRTYNFFPQSPFSNLEYYGTMERDVYDFLERAESADALVDIFVELVYADYYIAGLSPDRPRSIKVSVRYSNGKHTYFEMSNM